VMQGAMALIKQAYGNLNSPPSANPAASFGPGPAYLQSQLAGYQTALSFISTLTPTTGTTSLF